MFRECQLLPLGSGHRYTVNCMSQFGNEIDFPSYKYEKYGVQDVTQEWRRLFMYDRARAY